MWASRPRGNTSVSRAVGDDRSGAVGQQRRISVTGAIAVLGLCWMSFTTMRAVNAQESPREGQCEDADVLFPDRNPGPGSLQAIPIPEPTNLAAASTT